MSIRKSSFSLVKEYREWSRSFFVFIKNLFKIILTLNDIKMSYTWLTITHRLEEKVCIESCRISRIEFNLCDSSVCVGCGELGSQVGMRPASPMLTIDGYLLSSKGGINVLSCRRMVMIFSGLASWKCEDSQWNALRTINSFIWPNISFV